jgi:hypothetical protein
MVRAPYRIVIRRGHPLAYVGGQAAEHRVVLYDHIGPGVHPCHWCSTPVEWTKKAYNRKGNLTVDHLDGDKHNNALENLVPACSSCNTKRGLDHKTVKDDEVFVIRADGRKARATKRTCAGCETEFLVESRALRTGEKLGKPRGVYCSRQCRNVHLIKAQAPQKRP